MGKLRTRDAVQKPPEEEPGYRSGNGIKGILTIGIFVALALFMFSGGVTADYQEDGVTLRGGGYNTELLFTEVTDVQLLSSPFQVGERVYGVEKARYYAGNFQGGSLADAGTYTLYLDKDYRGDVVVVSYGEEYTLAAGSANLDMLFLYDYLREGAGLTD